MNRLVDILWKTGRWLWDSKERAVLGVMAIVLLYRVYVIIDPPAQEPVQPPPPPQSEGQVAVPEPPAEPPEPPAPDYDPDELVSENPFWANPR